MNASKGGGGGEDQEQEQAWSLPPTRDPPSWSKFSISYQEDPVLAVQDAKVHGNSNANATTDDDDAGDIPSAFYAEDSNLMDGRRLLIRICASQAEVLAGRASYFSSKDCKQFQEGAMQLQLALGKIHQALQVADTQISKWWVFMETAEAEGESPSSKAKLTTEKEQLVQDANIVEISIQSMTQRREKLLDLCYQEQNWLLRKLQPQWEDRDNVKQRMGERWTNNPRPKFDFAKLRREYEARLRIVRQAMEVLQELDPSLALQKTSDLQAQLKSGTRRPESSNSGGHKKPNDFDEEALNKRRYNGLRPNLEWASRRVDARQYPDPTAFGWKFTGSWQAVEFFERKVNGDLIKLDWYFTTATVKTSLDHPKQGKTQLFCKPVSSSQYTEILKNPRSHTGNRYQKRRNRGGRRNRNKEGLVPSQVAA
ncbi:MAG: hypothetical protein SGILL_001378 [Bacillariaceae sp.]